MELNKTDVLILCGGLGTRFQKVMSDRPKGLAPVGEKPLLELQIDDLVTQGAKRIILCVGHLHEQIVEYFKNRSDVEMEFSVEETPLGTGGALKNAEPLLRSDPVFALNGDSLCQLSLEKFFHYHMAQHATCSLVLSETQTGQDYGNVSLDSGGRIQSFQEKISQFGIGLINAGIYLMQRETFALMPKILPFSLEYDFFPKLIQSHYCFGFPVDSQLLDIGTPERYNKARWLYTK